MNLTVIYVQHKGLLNVDRTQHNVLKEDSNVMGLVTALMEKMRSDVIQS